MNQHSHRRGSLHDAFFRNTFLNLNRARSLLEGLLAPELVLALDWRTLRLCGGRFSDGRLKQAESDLLFRVRFRRRSKWLYILVEHKSGPWWRAAFDLLRYCVHFWDRWLDDHPRSRRLPPLLPLVVHHGRRGWSSAGNLQELLDLQGLPHATASMLRQWLPQLHYLLADLSRLDNQELRSLRLSDVVKVRLLAMQPGRRLGPRAAPQAMERNQDLVRRVLRTPQGWSVMAAVWAYLAEVSDLPPQKLARMIGTITMTKTTFKSTHDQILEKGKAEEKVEGLLRQLRKRFGRLPDRVVARVQRASWVELDRWSMRILNASTLQAVFSVPRRRSSTTTRARRHPTADSRR